ncbi:MAG TPA: sigma-70 family RNA polymerase sigma factor [Bryobacteraceae bacterium]|nr:sigma-70 family RNA polymerase sigma factor [Bryobacteraceae bacterium]
MGESPTGGSEVLFERLLKVNRQALRRLAASYARVASDQDDLLQEIAIALWRALPKFRGECSERAFLFRIAHNRCMSYVVKRRSTIGLLDTQVDPEDPRCNVEAQLSREHERGRLARAIQQLPLIYREVVLLMLEGLDYREISEVVGISESNVGARLNRARQQLKKAMDEELS